jgi:hypothetical protein
MKIVFHKHDMLDLIRIRNKNIIIIFKNPKSPKILLSFLFKINKMLSKFGTLQTALVFRMLRYLIFKLVHFDLKIYIFGTGEVN